MVKARYMNSTYIPNGSLIVGWKEYITNRNAKRNILINSCGRFLVQTDFSNPLTHYKLPKFLFFLFFFWVGTNVSFLSGLTLNPQNTRIILLLVFFVTRLIKQAKDKRKKKETQTIFYKKVPAASLMRI
jgi:hypothetical protein